MKPKYYMYIKLEDKRKNQMKPKEDRKAKLYQIYLNYFKKENIKSITNEECLIEITRTLQLKKNFQNCEMKMLQNEIENKLSLKPICIISSSIEEARNKLLLMPKHTQEKTYDLESEHITKEYLSLEKEFKEDSTEEMMTMIKELTNRLIEKHLYTNCIHLIYHSKMKRKYNQELESKLNTKTNLFPIIQRKGLKLYEDIKNKGNGKVTLSFEIVG